MTTLDQLKEKADSLQSAANLARREYNEALKASDAAWKVGEVGTAMRMYGGYPIKKAPCDILITRVQVLHGGTLHYWGKWRKKDGSWSLREHEVWGRIYDQGWQPVHHESLQPTEDML